VTAHRPRTSARSRRTSRSISNYARAGAAARHPAPADPGRGLDEQIAVYLKETQEWEGSDGVPVHERRFLQKKRRAAIFESKHQA